ncbi:MAG: hypothetical protein KDA35_00945 [Hyphomonadaceae bacterium]|nr:hypothetical protein [Hyphomonadaceae bacterium]
MTIKPQKTATNKTKAQLEGSEHQLSEAKQRLHSEVEEKIDKNTRAKKSAQKQHDAQPEVATTLQGLTEMQSPAMEQPGREDAVPGRRKSDEFALRVSEAALLHMAHREPSYLPKVKEAAYECIYESERILCGHIVQIGNVPEVNPSRWWRPFEVDGLWFVLKPCELPRFSKVREYELLPATGPTPDDDVPPKLIRKQKTPPPEYIGPRKRRNRRDVNGSRARGGKPSMQQGGKKKGLKRVLVEMSGAALTELELLSQNTLRDVVQAWRKTKPVLFAGARHIRLTSGSALRDLRDALASLVQSERVSRVFSVWGREALTHQRHVEPETIGPCGRLVQSDAGHNVSPRLRLNSWAWDEPPLPRAEFFGALWPPHWFGVREEEQVFT